MTKLVLAVFVTVAMAKSALELAGFATPPAEIAHEVTE
jgi:hypothetical protein